MGKTPETRLITKNTFLEIVSVVDETCLDTEKRRRSFTDGAITCQERKNSEKQIESQPILHPAHHRRSQEPEPLQERCLAAGDLCQQQASPTHARLAQENARLAQENAQLQAIAENTKSVAAVPAASFPQASGAEQNAAMMASMMAMAKAYPQRYFVQWQPMMIMPDQSCAKALEAPAMPERSQRMQPAQAGALPMPTRGLLNKLPIGAPQGNLNHAHHVAGNAPATDEFTTIMLRNLPNLYTRDMLVDLLNNEGFAGKYTFVYLPIDFKTHAGLGYAFVDLISPYETDRMRQHFEGFSSWALRSEKVCSVSWSHPEQQGFAAHVDRYRNSPVMHNSVPESWKPALFSQGVHLTFPAPTKKLRNPHIRNLQQ